MDFGIQSFGAEIAHTAQSKGNRVADLDGLVFHHGDQDTQSLPNQRLLNLVVGAIHDGTEGRNSSVPTTPVLATDVLFDKSQHGLHDITLNALSVELQGLVSSTRNVVFVFIGVLILLAHVFQQDRDDFSACHPGKAEEWPYFGNTFRLCLSEKKKKKKNHHQ